MCVFIQGRYTHTFLNHSKHYILYMCKYIEIYSITYSYFKTYVLSTGHKYVSVLIVHIKLVSIKNKNIH